MLTEVIAEAGLNHNGSEPLAMRMVEQALNAGADTIKFQTFDLDKLLRPGDPTRSILEPLVLPKPAFIRLARYCVASNVEFLSTPGELDSLKFLVEEVGVKRLKIGSDDLTNHALIEAALASGLPLIISTGMATLFEIDELALPTDYDITLLHCVSLYPCPRSKVNLMAMGVLRLNYGFKVGYSDHTSGIDACVIAAARDAVIVEKHFMPSDHPAEGEFIDQKVSVGPKLLKQMIDSIKSVERILGDGKKEPSPEEARNVPLLRKGSDGFRGWQ